MKISIVTVCYNAENYILQTIKSVFEQDYPNIEYLIQDGGSTDGTLNLVDEYCKEHSVKEKILLSSEKDKGIYDAMNKATLRATGDYIIFMNSGDMFYDAYAVSKIVNSINNLAKTPDIIYGDVLRKKPSGDILETYSGKKPLLKLLLTGNIPSHQSTFAKTDLMRKLKFDESYSITADYDFYVRAYSLKKDIYYAHGTVVAIVDNTTGISSERENLDRMRKEDDRSLKKNLPLWYHLINIPKKFYRVIIDRKNS